MRYYAKHWFLVVSVAFLGAVDVWAQDTGPARRYVSFRTPYEFWLTCAIVLWGLIVLCAFTYVSNRIEDRRLEDTSRGTIVISVVIAALILATAGYNNEQIAAAYALFGSIVGYVFGRGRVTRRTRQDDPTSGSSDRSD
jgi:membrane associated rhomboid family serine protease